jgi:NhaA family Na+:H+ antiporter
VFGLLVQRGIRRWWLLLPLAVATWALVHASGVHATVAGVLLAFTVPVRHRRNGPGLAEAFEHRWRPVSAGLAVPVFAFFAAGVSVADTGGLGAGLTNAVTLGIIAALLLGKSVGITGSAWLVHRFTRAGLAEGLTWWDVIGLGLLGGIGFTVSLLIGELAFGTGTVRDGYAKVGVLAGSVLSALVAAIVLRVRNRHYRKLAAVEATDADDDGIPDVFQDTASPT